jgi:mannan endo-1,4-beta-mannosidase
MKKKHRIVFTAPLLVCATLFGCAGESDSGQTQVSSATEEQTDAETTTETAEETTPAVELPERPQRPTEDVTPMVYEAEDAIFTGSAFAKEASGCSGTGYADGLFKAGEDMITFQVDIPYGYYYDLTFLASSGGAEKYNYILIDGQEIGTLKTDTADFEECTMNQIYLDAGTHDISIEAYWGYVKFDSLTVSLGEDLDLSIYEVSADLINPDADTTTKGLMKYLTDVYGKQFLTGQYGDEGFFSNEVQAISNVTGKLPAVLGLDMIEYSPSRVENGSSSSSVERAIDWWDRGGIVTMCWHWNAPSKYITGDWYSGFRAEATNIDLAKIMNGEDEEGYELLMEDIDAIAVQLQRLQEAGVPILWRPLHEASGGWFWWGASGAEAYKQLWVLLYDKLTNEYGLNNLIWLWNGQDADWYPGDEYVDIIGEDIYPGNQVSTSQVTKYMEAVNYTSAKKMVVLSENGCVFDPDLAYRDGAMWGFYCTWGGEFVLKTSTLNRYSENYTTEEVLKKMYDSPLSITLDELPDLKNYPTD